eukprot:GFYU01028965.1.p1 GENE.GFYU01028965.1~~GFYU01028965.1.p1  ORF type:complete len:211 (-),score=5.73 GFYU01028965.1:189-821(-)
MDQRSAKRIKREAGLPSSSSQGRQSQPTATTTVTATSTTATAAPQYQFVHPVSRTTPTPTVPTSVWLGEFTLKGASWIDPVEENCVFSTREAAEAAAGPILDANCRSEGLWRCGLKGYGMEGDENIYATKITVTPEETVFEVGRDADQDCWSTYRVRQVTVDAVTPGDLPRPRKVRSTADRSLWWAHDEYDDTDEDGYDDEDEDGDVYST